MTLPLKDTIVVLTRSREDSLETAELLKNRGAQVVIFPTIEYRLPDTLAENIQLTRNLNEFQYILLSSPNAARMLIKTIEKAGLTGDLTRGVKALCIGKETAKIAGNLGFNVFFTGEKATSADFPSEIEKADIKPGKLLQPVSNLGSSSRKTGGANLHNSLSKLGFDVRESVFYITAAPTKPDVEALEKMAAGVDVVTFFSPSAISGFLSLVPPGLIQKIKRDSTIAVIGPSTKNAALEAGFNPRIQAGTPSAEALVNALVMEKSRI